MKIRLDDMTIDDVKILYNAMFNDLIDTEKLDEVYEIYLVKYSEMKAFEENGYQAPSGMGRKFNYLKNMLYGWYIEDLFYILLNKNPRVLTVELTGDDSTHNFIYDHENKTVKIEGEKTTNPDYLITLNSGKKIYLELKTAAAEVYSIKIGNVKQLQKTMGFTSIYSMIIMIDLVNGLYEIKDLDFFLNSSPFVNNRMEGQLCYDFPAPTKPFSKISDEDFSSYIKEELFSNEEVKKFKCLFLATKCEDKKMKRDIKNKISLDELTSEFKYTQNEYEGRIEKLLGKSPNIECKSWDDFLDELENLDI